MTSYHISYLDCTDQNQLELCASHYRKCWRETYSARLSKRGISELLRQANCSEISRWVIGNGDRNLALAYSGDKIIGAVACNCIQNRCYIWGMYVLRSYRRKGVGALLLQNCIENANNNKIDAMELFVLESSTEAVNFYQKAGFLILETTTYELVPGVQLQAFSMALDCSQA